MSHTPHPYCLPYVSQQAQCVYVLPLRTVRNFLASGKPQKYSASELNLNHANECHIISARQTSAQNVYKLTTVPQASVVQHTLTVPGLDGGAQLILVVLVQAAQVVPCTLVERHLLQGGSAVVRLALQHLAGQHLRPAVHVEPAL